MCLLFMQIVHDGDDPLHDPLSQAIRDKSGHHQPCGPKQDVTHHHGGPGQQDTVCKPSNMAIIGSYNAGISTA